MFDLRPENFEKISKDFINSITDFSPLRKNEVSSAYSVHRNVFSKILRLLIFSFYIINKSAVSNCIFLSIDLLKKLIKGYAGITVYWSEIFFIIFLKEIFFCEIVWNIFWYWTTCLSDLLESLVSRHWYFCFYSSAKF